jgi:hypothetical protein
MPYDPLQKAFLSIFCGVDGMPQCFDVDRCQRTNATDASTCTRTFGSCYRTDF